MPSEKTSQRPEGQKDITMARKTASTSITGRDGYIVPQAMLYAIGYIQSLPDERQEWSNMQNMCMIVRAQQSAFTISHILNLERFHGFKIDLWPEGDEALSKADKERRDEFRRVHEEHRKRDIEFSIEHAHPFCFMPTPSFAGYDQKHLTGSTQREAA